MLPSCGLNEFVHFASLQSSKDPGRNRLGSGIIRVLSDMGLVSIARLEDRADVKFPRLAVGATELGDTSLVSVAGPFGCP